jgi:trimeric autotransporter adhesin
MWRNDELDGAHRSGPGTGRRARSLAALLAVTSLAAGVVVAASAADTRAAGPSALDGLSSADAAASCWEIKQLHPESADGIYWLRTDQLVRPAQFYCDMTTEGGGWVLIARGRQGWTFRDYGQSTPKALRDDITGPAAFSPAALDTETIDGLLGGGSVKDLADGLRVRRAADKTGSSWQDLRWRFADLTSWSWAFGGGHRLSAFSIDGTAGTGSNTKDSSITMWGEIAGGNRAGANLDGWYTFPWSGHGRQAGFSYRGTVEGDNSATSYLWQYASEKQAVPFTQLWLRPRLTTVAAAPIADSGLAAQTLSPMLDDRPAELAGGVSGVLKVGDTEPQLDTPVLALTTFGNRVYVGGKFSDSRDTVTGKLVPQSYLAAFDRSTGAWISTFRPVLDGTVWDLDVAGGRLIVAGQFTNINGTPGTSALAAIDPVTGAVDPTWRASLSVSGTTSRPLARAIDVEGSWIYVGGNFTSIASSARTLPVGRLARVDVATGNPDTRFRPNVTGVPYDVDAANGIVQVAGNIKGINGDGRIGVGTLNAADGSVVAGLAPPLWTSPNKQYQQAVLAVGGEVWQGGSEHNVHVYRANDYSLQKAYLMQDQGGDTQVFAQAGNDVIQGSHGNAYTYEDATSYQTLANYTRADVYNWVGAFDITTRRYDKGFVPGLRSAYSEGAWALSTDADGCVWFGGDFLGGPYVNGTRQYLEGFSKFCPRDTVPPSVPVAVANTGGTGGVRLTWNPSSDDRAGYVGYEVLRNDRVVSPLVYGTTYTDPGGSTTDRYFVRAVDAAGNRSATTSVLRAVDSLKPTTPRDLAATVRPDRSIDLTWTASTDDVGVAGYRVLHNGVELVIVPGTQTSVNLPDLGRGAHLLQVQAIDGAGNESNKTASVEVDLGGADVSAPSVPTGLAVKVEPATVRVTATWAASTDDVGVTGYAVYRNGKLVTTVAGDATAAVLDLGYGNHYIQVAARDAAGNESAKTESVLASLVAPDTSGPSVPAGLGAVVDPVTRLVTVTWSASTDPAGVASYSVFRNGTLVTTVRGDVTTAIVDLGTGSHSVQVSATDTLGNQSAMTAAVIVDIAAPVSADTSNPSTPRDLAAVVQSNGSVDLTWSASRDDVGVVSYRVTRNGNQVAMVPGSETSVNLPSLGAGDHYLQVQAFDAAGNSSYRTASVKVTIVAPPTADTTNPSTPKNVTAVPRSDGSVDVAWTASRDNVGVVSYRVTRNGVQVAVVPGTDTGVNVTGLGTGTHYIQVQAFDAAGNASYRTASVIVVL